MSTQTLRHLCDAMDALDAARSVTLDGMLEDTIDAARDKVSFAMTDTVAAFDIEACEVDQQYWRAGYEAALEDFEITEDDVSEADEPQDDLYDEICGLFEAGTISATAFNRLIEAHEDGRVRTEAFSLHAFGHMSRDALTAIIQATR